MYLTEDDLFEFEFERSCFSADTFELGGVQAKSVYLLIDNNAQSFSRGTFAGRRMTLEINGKYFGIYTVGNPKRRNGVIELTAYDDMVKLDCEYPSTYEFPQLFLQVYAQCLFEAGIADDISKDNFVLNALFNNGVISHEYTDYIYANSCRNLVSGMAEWNGGFAYMNDDNKLQVDVFSKEITREYSSDELMDFDYSDETVVFSRVRTSQKNKTYEMGDDSGYTLVLNNQYIGYGLTDAMFETYFQFIYDYYNGFSLTPMSFTLAEPDTELKLGDRVTVYDTEENISVTGNVSKIIISGNCSMTVTCGGFGSVESRNYKSTSSSQLSQTGTDAKVNNDVAARGTLTEYTVLSDTEIKYNGVTYTFSAGESGEITGVTTDKGGAFTPTIPGTLADISAHNAAFMAVALLSKLSGEPVPAENIPYSIARWVADDYVEGTLEGNSVITVSDKISGAGDYIFGNGVFEDGGIKIPCTSSSNIGQAAISLGKSLSAFTVYAVMRGTSGTDRGMHLVTDSVWSYNSLFELGTGGSSEAYWAAIMNKTGWSKSSVSKLETAVMCIAYTGTAASFYVNGTLIEQKSISGWNIPQTCYVRNGNTAMQYFDNSPLYFYDFAICDVAHDGTTVGEVSATLMSKYNTT